LDDVLGERNETVQDAALALDVLVGVLEEAKCPGREEVDVVLIEGVVDSRESAVEELAGLGDVLLKGVV